jgi:DNA-binding NtrC family response regulator
LSFDLLQACFGVGEDFSEERRVMSCSLRALLISSEAERSRELAQILLQCGVSSTICAGWAPARIRLMEPASLDLVVCEDRLHDGSFRDVLEFAKNAPVKLPVLVYSPSGDFAAYLEAMEAGAFDFMVPPYRVRELQAIFADVQRHVASEKKPVATVTANGGH